MNNDPFAGALMTADAQFAAACKQLAHIAQLNAAAVTTTLEAFDHEAEVERLHAPQSVAFAIAQVMQLYKAVLCLAISTEMDNASGELLTEH